MSSSLMVRSALCVALMLFQTPAWRVEKQTSDSQIKAATTDEEHVNNLAAPPFLRKSSATTDKENVNGSGLLDSRKNSESATIAVLAADFVLAALACWLMFSNWRLGTNTLGMGVTTPAQASIFGIYIFFSVSHMFFQRRAGKTGYTFLAGAIMVYFCKVVVSFIMWLCKGDLKAGLSTICRPGCTRFGNIPGCLLPMIPGGLFAVYDALSFVGLQHLDPATYQVFVRMRIVFVGLLWQTMFNRKLSATQWLAFILILTAGLTKGIDHLAMDGDSFRIQDVGLMLAMNCMSVFASVATEVLFKEMPMPIDLVNTFTYLWGILWLVAVLMCTEGVDSLHRQVFSEDAWQKLLSDPWMIGSICCMTAFGIVTAYLLKELSNITKELAGGVVIIFSSVVAWSAAISAITVPEVVGTVMAVLGIVVYSTAPLKK